VNGKKLKKTTENICGLEESTLFCTTQSEYYRFSVIPVTLTMTFSKELEKCNLKICMEPSKPKKPKQP
jgi:hypothetical protein